MPSSREQSPQRKKASLESGFLVHFTSKMPYELMATKLTSLDCLTVHKNFRNSLQKDFHIILFILKPPIRSKWVPFYRCRNWESRRLRNLFRVSKEEASRARAQTFIFKFPISHSFSQSFTYHFHWGTLQHRGVCPSVKTIYFISLEFQHYFSSFHSFHMLFQMKTIGFQHESILNFY